MRDQKRRQVLQTTGVITVGSIGGCLRLETGGNGGSGSGGNDPSNVIELNSIWETSVGSEISARAGDFYHGTRRLSRVDTAGDILFQTEPFDEYIEEYFININDTWRNSLHVGSDQVFVGLVANDDSKGGVLVALDSEEGTVQWSHSESDDGLHNRILSPVATDSEVIFVSQSSGSGSDQQPLVKGLDKRTGSPNWNISFDGVFVNNMYVTNNMLIIEKLREIAVYDVTTQKLISKFDIGSGFERAKYEGGTIFAPGSEIVAADIETGDRLWTKEPGYQLSTDTCLGDEAVFYGSDSGFVFGYNRNSGDQLWEQRVDGTVGNPLIYSNDILWVGTETGSLYAFGAESGNQLFQTSVASDFSFAVQDGVLLDSERGIGYEIQNI